MELRPLVRGEEEELRAVAAADGHPVLYPTYGMFKEKQIVGYASLPWSPTIYYWSDSNAVNALDSARNLIKMERIVRMHGFKSIMIPCAKSSPHYEYMKRFGFEELGTSVFFRKEIT